MSVRIEIEQSEVLNHWNWEATVDGNTMYGYANDYMNAESMAREAAMEMGADV